MTKKDSLAVSQNSKAVEGMAIGTTTGGITGGVIRAMMPEHKVKFYEDAIEKGAVLIGLLTGVQRRKV